MPHIEVTETVLVHCNIVNNDYQQDWRILYTFVPNKYFGQLLENSATNFIFLKSFIGTSMNWCVDQNSQPKQKIE